MRSKKSDKKQNETTGDETLKWTDPELILLNNVKRARGVPCYNGNSDAVDCCTGNGYIGMGCETGPCPPM